MNFLNPLKIESFSGFVPSPENREAPLPPITKKISAFAQEAIEEKKLDLEREVSPLPLQIQQLPLNPLPLLSQFKAGKIDIGTLSLEEAISFVNETVRGWELRDLEKDLDPIKFYSGDYAFKTTLFLSEAVGEIEKKIGWAVPVGETIPFIVETIKSFYENFGLIDFGAGTALIPALLAKEEPGTFICLETDDLSLYTSYCKRQEPFHPIQRHADCLPIIEQYAPNLPLFLSFPMKRGSSSEDAILAYEKAGGRMIIIIGNDDFTGTRKMWKILRNSDRWIQKEAPKEVSMARFNPNAGSELLVFVKKS